MKILLRHGRTGLYVLDADHWTGNPDEAFDFKAMRRAIEFAEETGFTRMELALVSDDPRQLTAVPVESLRCRPLGSDRGLRPN